jgi:hypothetical protein
MRFLVARKTHIHNRCAIQRRSAINVIAQSMTLAYPSLRDFHFFLPSLCVEVTVKGEGALLILEWRAL